MTNTVKTVTRAVYRNRTTGRWVSPTQRNKASTRKQFVKVPVQTTRG